MYTEVYGTIRSYAALRALNWIVIYIPFFFFFFFFFFFSPNRSASESREAPERSRHLIVL